MKKIFFLLVFLIVISNIGFAGFIKETVFSTGDVGQYSSIDLDIDGNPHISYFFVGNVDLKYSYYDGNIWTHKVGDYGGNVGQYSSIAIDDNGNAHMSYYSVDNSVFENQLKYTFWDGGRHTQIIQWNDVGQHTSIALNSTGSPHISYYDDTADNLKHAYFVGGGGNCGGGKWNCEIVEWEGDVGKYSSIVIDKNNVIHISYYDDTTDDLKHAYLVETGGNCGEGKWNCEIVDAIGTVGQYTSIAVDEIGKSYISYYDGTNDDLKYAYWDGTKWNPKTVDSNGDVGKYSSIALDDDDNPHISYYDGTADKKDLKYAYWDGTKWNPKTVDSEGDVGTWTSIAVDGNGIPHMSYYDDTVNKKDLKYAYYIKPLITSVTPTTGYTSNKDITKITVTTNIELDCKGVKTKNEWIDLSDPFYSLDKLEHTLGVDYSENGNYEFYISCEDTDGTIVSYDLSFTINKELCGNDECEDDEECIDDVCIEVDCKIEGLSPSRR